MANPEIRVGDHYIRMIAGKVPHPVEVAQVLPDKIVMHGGWEFDPHTGAEIDDYLGWGPPPKMTGSYINWAHKVQ